MGGGGVSTFVRQKKNNRAFACSKAVIGWKKLSKSIWKKYVSYIIPLLIFKFDDYEFLFLKNYQIVYLGERNILSRWIILRNQTNFYNKKICLWIFQIKIMQFVIKQNYCIFMQITLVSIKNNLQCKRRLKLNHTEWSSKCLVLTFPLRKEQANSLNVL